MLRRILFVICLLVAVAEANCQAYSFVGQVDYVLDGDTLSVVSDGGYHRVRLAGVDAPELSQPYGLEAAMVMRKLVQGQTVLVSVVDEDKYGREVGRVFVNNRCLSCALLAKGAAWHWQYFDKSSTHFAQHSQLEKQAKEKKLGLWKVGEAIAPWEWRTLNIMKN